MRTPISKKHYTKPERIFARLLQEHKIPFRSKVIIGGKEVDFVIGNIAVEINGHVQNGERNHYLADKGYVPIHFHNSELYEDRLKVLKVIKQLYGIH